MEACGDDCSTFCRIWPFVHLSSDLPSILNLSVLRCRIVGPSFVNFLSSQPASHQISSFLNFINHSSSSRFGDPLPFPIHLKPPSATDKLWATTTRPSSKSPPDLGAALPHRSTPAPFRCHFEPGKCRNGALTSNVLMTRTILLSIGSDYPSPQPFLSCRLFRGALIWAAHCCMLYKVR